MVTKTIYYILAYNTGVEITTEKDRGYSCSDHNLEGTTTSFLKAKEIAKHYIDTKISLFQQDVDECRGSKSMLLKLRKKELE